MDTPANQTFEFGEFRLETAERLLLRAGSPVSLTPKVFDTLVVLVNSRGRLVRKEDLMKQVWPDAIVEEANLARNIWMLRKALGDADGETYIETVPKIGYRFVAPVREGGAAQAVAAPAVTPPQTPPPFARSYVRPAALVAVVLIAVVLGSLGFTRLFRNTPDTSSAPGLTLLTDGNQDDAGASWTNDGRIYFSRSISATRVETWTMSGDGSNARRANTEIRNLLTGRWSPDGRKVIFRRDDGEPGTFLADANGGNLVRLTGEIGNLDWAPDGSRFVYQARNSAGTFELYLYTLTTGTAVNLTRGASSADPSFSNDGSRIAFTSWRDGNAEIYVMDADGSNVRRLTNHAAFDNYPVFSPDGTQIAFQSNREDEHVEIYLQNLNDDAPPRRLTHSKSLTGLAPKCWSPDGSQMLVYTEARGKGQIAVLTVEAFPARPVLADPDADLGHPRVSRDGRRLLYEARLLDRSLEIRLTDLAANRTDRLFRTEPDYPMGFHLEPVWSRDESLIAFSARSNGNSEIFVMKADGGGVRNLTNNALIDASPEFLPDNSLVFSRDAFGQAQLFRMDGAGGDQRRITSKSGYEMNPSISPDGLMLAFAGDRDSHGLDILMIDLRRPDAETRLAGRRGQDGSPAFSTDGRRIAFLATSDGNPEIYVMNADGTGLFRVTRTPADETSPQFFRDSEHIIFSSNRAGRFALYESSLR